VCTLFAEICAHDQIYERSVWAVSGTNSLPPCLQVVLDSSYTLFCSVFALWIGPIPLVFVGDIKVARQVLSNSHAFQKGPMYTETFALVFGQGLVTSNDRTVQHIVGKYFVKKSVEVCDKTIYHIIIPIYYDMANQ
jgi:hypothetical protein